LAAALPVSGPAAGGVLGAATSAVDGAVSTADGAFGVACFFCFLRNQGRGK
jgi:hypothetical protein